MPELPRIMATIATNAMSHATHAATYPRVVIRLLMTCLLVTQTLVSPTQVTRRRKWILACCESQREKVAGA